MTYFANLDPNSAANLRAAAQFEDDLAEWDRTHPGWEAREGYGDTIVGEADIAPLPEPPHVADTAAWEAYREVMWSDPAEWSDR